ncbi:MAG: DUF4406 domain-containing protein [Ruminococcus sp.]|nr:DUF4406 domain-containing protein [Ruminococcus sp.]
MKIFISQPMRGQTEEAILKTRSEAVKKIKAMYGDDVEILDSFFDDFDASNVKNPGVAYLAKSIAVLAEADIAYFCKGYENTRGCMIEYEIAKAYGIKISKE